MSRLQHTIPWKKVAPPLFSARPACRDVDPELFFCERDGGGIDQAQLEEARAVCRRCPVIRECLAWAVRHEVHGVWGGLTRSERNRRRGTP